MVPALDVVPELAGAAPENTDGFQTETPSRTSRSRWRPLATRVSIGDAEANDVFLAIARVRL